MESAKEKDGSTTEYAKVTEKNEDYTESFVAKDAEGNVTESREASREDSRKTDEATGAVTETVKVTDKDGTVESEKVEQENEDFVEKSETKADYTPAKEGITLNKVETNGDTFAIPDTVSAADGNTYPVTEIGKGAMQGNTNVAFVSLGSNIKKICTYAFRGAKNMIRLILGAFIPSKQSKTPVSAEKKSTITLGKNSLKGTSRDLVIWVSSKEDKKAVKKQLKKAGNTRAKIKVGDIYS